MHLDIQIFPPAFSGNSEAQHCTDPHNRYQSKTYTHRPRLASALHIERPRRQAKTQLQPGDIACPSVDPAHAEPAQRTQRVIRARP